MSSLTFRAGAASHVGLVRTMNEDSFKVGSQLFAVADGMGGHLAGEVASQMAIRALDPLDQADEMGSVDTVVAAVVEANDKILQMSREDPTRRGMGTTLTALALVGTTDGVDGHANGIAVVNLGDSRTYRFRDGELEQITTDHSYVQELVTGGHLTQDEARNHPQRNIVTRALGIETGVGIDVWNLPLVVGDRYLLCSDGLVDEVTDDRIADVLAGLDDPQSAAEHLVDMANRAGGRDNVTVIVVDVIDAADAPPATPPDPDATPTTAEIPVILAEPVAAEPVPVAPVPAEPVPETSTDRAGMSEPSPPAAPLLPPKDKGRRTIKVVAVLGGAALMIGIVLVATRGGGGGAPAPTSTTPSSTMVVTTSATTAPSTTTP